MNCRKMNNSICFGLQYLRQAAEGCHTILITDIPQNTPHAGWRAQTPAARRSGAAGDGDATKDHKPAAPIELDILFIWGG